MKILANSIALARRAADWPLETATAKHGRIAVALTGGVTPQRLYPAERFSPTGTLHVFADAAAAGGPP